MDPTIQVGALVAPAITWRGYVGKVTNYLVFDVVLFVLVESFEDEINRFISTHIWSATF